MFGKLGLGLGLGGGGGGLLPETNAYIARVQADGGIIGDVKSVNTAIKLFKDNLIWGIMIDGGLAREAGSPSYITKIYDLATASRDCSQATPAARPFYVENAIGGKPGIRFSGAQFMEFGNDNLINSTQPFSLIMVFKPKAIGATTYGHTACIRTELDTGMFLNYITTASAYKIWGFGHVTGARLRIDNDTLFAVDTPVHTITIYNGEGWNTVGNYAAAVNGNVIATTGAGSFASTKLSNRIGFLNSSNHYLNAEICEILLLNTNTLTATINAYLKAKYGFGA
ncbi:MAG TPA: hypothetical protein P5214_05055 [Rectinema sp.]|nr:hypothetical protein [Rectinema sp.]